MTLPSQFTEDNFENIRIYHFVEEMVIDYKNFMTKLFENYDISISEAPFIIRIRFAENSTQQELAKIFNVSEGYTAKLMRKFEDKGLISRIENPNNRRKKIVSLTSEGIKKTDEIISFMDKWESSVTRSLSDEDVKSLKKMLFSVVTEHEKLE